MSYRFDTNQLDQSKQLCNPSKKKKKLALDTKTCAAVTWRMVQHSLGKLKTNVRSRAIRFRSRMCSEKFRIGGRPFLLRRAGLPDQSAELNLSCSVQDTDHFPGGSRQWNICSAAGVVRRSSCRQLLFADSGIHRRHGNNLSASRSHCAHYFTCQWLRAGCFIYHDIFHISYFRGCCALCVNLLYFYFSLHSMQQTRVANQRGRSGGRGDTTLTDFPCPGL